MTIVQGNIRVSEGIWMDISSIRDPCYSGNSSLTVGYTLKGQGLLVPYLFLKMCSLKNKLHHLVPPTRSLRGLRSKSGSSYLNIECTGLESVS
jgi:hypothetical protein